MADDCTYTLCKIMLRCPVIKQTECNDDLSGVRELNYLSLLSHAGFAELQTDLDELTGDVAGGRLPYVDMKSYLLTSLFPGATDHSTLHELQVCMQLYIYNLCLISTGRKTRMHTCQAEFSMARFLVSKAREWKTAVTND